jgi:hypothetical protein
MALSPGQTSISREHVYGWIQSWKKMSRKNRPPIEDYIRKRVEHLNLDDPMIDTSAEGRDSMPNEVHTADLIIDDLPSYGINATGS